MKKAPESHEFIREYSIGVASGIKAFFDRLFYSNDDFRHYYNLWYGVNGWLTFKQANWLFDIAKVTAQKGDIIEIGSAYGRSTICLALGVSIRGRDKVVYSVDPHIGGIGFRETLKDKDKYSSFDGFKANLKRFKVEKWVVPVVKTSEAALKGWKGGKAGLVFIDGWHTYDAVKHDILGWSKHVLTGGIIALHDYQEENVRRAIHDSLRELGIKETELKHVDGEMVFFILP